MIEEKLVIPNRKYIRIPGVPKRDPVADKSSYQVKSEVDTTEYDSSETQHEEPEDLTDITNVVTEEVLNLSHRNRSTPHDKDREKKSKEEGYNSDGHEGGKGLRAWASRKLKMNKKSPSGNVLPADDLVASEIPPELNYNLNIPEPSPRSSESLSNTSYSLPNLTEREEVADNKNVVLGPKSHGKEEEDHNGNNKKKHKWSHRTRSQIDLKSNQEGEKFEDSAHEKKSKRERLRALWQDKKPAN